MKAAYLQPTAANVIVVPPVPRPPLDMSQVPSNVQQVLPWVPPEDRDYMRGNAWAVTIPGLPWVPGAASEHPDRCLTWFLDRWSLDWQDQILRTYCGRQYRHFVLSAPDSLGSTDPHPGGPPGAGQTLEQLVETCRRVKRYRAQSSPDPLYITMFLGSKVFQPADMSTSAWIAYVDPLLDALLPVVDEVVPGWEWNLFNIPGAVSIEVPKHIGARAHAAGVSCWLHFSIHVTSWFADGDPRGRYGYWADLGEDVDGILYQSDPAWTADELQARIVDTLHQFGEQGNRHKFRQFETLAIEQFTGNPPGSEHPNEDDGDRLDYLAACTTDVVSHTEAKVWGAGNGIRKPDGTPI